MYLYELGKQLPAVQGKKKRKDGSKLERQQAATLGLYNNITEGKTCVWRGEQEL